MVHLLDSPMLNSVMSRRSSQSPSMSYSQIAVVGSGPASHPTKRSSGGGGVRVGVTRPEECGVIEAAALQPGVLGTAGGADIRRDLSVGSMGLESTSGRAAARGVSPIASFRHFVRHLRRCGDSGSRRYRWVERAGLHKRYPECLTIAVSAADLRTPLPRTAFAWFRRQGCGGSMSCGIEMRRRNLPGDCLVGVGCAPRWGHSPSEHRSCGCGDVYCAERSSGPETVRLRDRPGSPRRSQR